jgi:hypothetical protein
MSKYHSALDIYAHLTEFCSNGHVTLPKVDPNIFMLSPSASDELVNSLDDPNAPSGSKSSSIVKTLIDEYRSMLEQERLGFLVLLGLYLLVIIFGLTAVLWHELVTPRLSARRKTQGLKTLQLGHAKEADTEKHPLAFMRSSGNTNVRFSTTKILPAFLQRCQAVLKPLSRTRRRKETESFATPDAYLVPAYPTTSQTEKSEDTGYSKAHSSDKGSSRVNLLDTFDGQNRPAAASLDDPRSATYNASLPLPPVPVLPNHRPVRSSPQAAAHAMRHASNPFASPFDAPTER